MTDICTADMCKIPEEHTFFFNFILKITEITFVKTSGCSGHVDALTISFLYYSPFQCRAEQTQLKHHICDIAELL